MIKPPYEIIKDFELALAAYTGAPYVCCVNSCTNALRLALDWQHRVIVNKHTHVVEFIPEEFNITIPSRTYVSVPIQIKKAGFIPKFEEIEWSGVYRLKPHLIYDSARRFHSGMFKYANKTAYVCVSFHWTKILGLGHGGAILHNDPDAVHFFREMRHDGRVEGMPIDNRHIQYLGDHCPMSPEIAAQGLVRLANLPKYNDDLPNSDYPDLSTFKVFK